MSAIRISNFGWVAVFLVGILTSGCSISNKEIKLLLIHDTTSSHIVSQLDALCRKQGLSIQKTTDLSYCVEDSLKSYSAIILDIPIDTLNHRQQNDLERYVLAGGGLMGINVHTNYMHKWPWMEALLHKDVNFRQMSEHFAVLASVKNSNAVKGITTHYGTGRVCVIYTKGLSKAKKNLENAVSYIINYKQRLGYQHVQKPRVPSPTPFSVVELVSNLDEPVDMEVLPEGHVIFTERGGGVKLFNATTHETKQIAHFSVNHNDCFGLTGIALDPDFQKNHWIYFGYRPQTDLAHQYISRFFMAEDSLILPTEKVILKIPAHQSAISLLEFDEKRNLFVGFSECLTSESLTFAEGEDKIDDQLQSSMVYGRQDHILKLNLPVDTTLVYSSADPDSTFTIYDWFQPGRSLQYFGYSNNVPYPKWGGIGISMDSLPHSPLSYDLQYKFPYLQTGNYFISGPRYHYDRYSSSINKLPQYYDKKLFLADWTKNSVLVATLDDHNQLEAIEPLLDTLTLVQPVKLKFAPDGSLYVLEHGPVGYLSHQNARLRHITYSQSNRAPIAKIDADVRSGAVPLSVNFSAQATFDYDPSDSLKFEWVFPDTVIHAGTKREVGYIFNKPGVYHPTLKVYDQSGSESLASITIVAGNASPKISIETETNRSFYWKSTKIPYTLNISDEKNGLTDTTWNANAVNLYAHPRNQLFNTASSVEMPSEGTLMLEAPPKDSLVDYSLVVNYEDEAVNGLPSNKVQEIFTIRYPQLYAVHSDESLGVKNRVDSTVWFVQNGGYFSFKDIDMREINHLKYRIKPRVNGFLELRLNAPTGPVVSTLRMSARESWVEFTVRVGQIEGSYDLFFVFRPQDESLEVAPQNILCMLEWIYFGKERIGAFYTNPDANDLL